MTPCPHLASKGWVGLAAMVCLTVRPLPLRSATRLRMATSIWRYSTPVPRGNPSTSSGNFPLLPGRESRRTSREKPARQQVRILNIDTGRRRASNLNWPGGFLMRLANFNGILAL
jgi:hypothetical protein